MEVVTENKALQLVCQRKSYYCPFSLMAAEEVLVLYENQELHVVWVKRVFIMYSTKNNKKNYYRHLKPQIFCKSNLRHIPV